MRKDIISFICIRVNACIFRHICIKLKNFIAFLVQKCGRREESVGAIEWVRARRSTYESRKRNRTNRSDSRAITA